MLPSLTLTKFVGLEVCIKKADFINSSQNFGPLSFNYFTVVEYEFFKSVRQIPRQKKVLTILAVEYINCTRQRSKFELKINKLKE